MFVDFNKLQLKYSVNGIDRGVASNINPNKYRAGISLYYVGDIIKLIDYESDWSKCTVFKMI